jgi:hypothetical protein
MDTIQTPKYSDDEVLIFGGKFADQFAAVFFARIQAMHGDTIRNAVADAVEVAIRDWPGDPYVPLPKNLIADMTVRAQHVAHEKLAALLEPLGGEEF